MKKQWIRRLLVTMLAMVLVITPFSALALSAPGAEPLSDETIKFTVGIPQSATVENWDTNRYTLLLENTLNVDLEFMELPSGTEFNQKVELMMIGGGNDLPDIIIGSFDTASLVNYAQMGMIVPVTEYYNTIAYHTQQTADLCTMPMKDMLKYVTSYDGEVYGLFGISESLNNMYSGNRLLVYKEWVDALGMEMPQTTDDLLELLRAIKATDLNGNGQNDEIPLMGYSDTVDTNLMRSLMNPFVYCQENFYMVQEDGTVTLSAMQDEWRDGLRFVAQLVDEGLISPLSFTQDKKQLTAVLTQEKPVVGVVANISMSILPASNPMRDEYYVIEPLTGPTGLKQTAKTPSIPNVRMIITKNCENPEAAFRMGDFMCREDVSLFNRFGEEGVEWAYLETPGMSDYEPLGYVGDITQMINPWGSLQNVYWANVGPQIMNGTFIFRVAADPNANNYTGNRRVAEGLVKEIEYANPNYVAGLVFNEEEQKVISEYKSMVNDYIAESFAQFVTGGKSIDSDWENYLSEFQRMGVENYLAAVNNAYARQNAAE